MNEVIRVELPGSNTYGFIRKDHSMLTTTGCLSLTIGSLSILEVKAITIHGPSNLSLQNKHQNKAIFLEIYPVDSVVLLKPESGLVQLLTWVTRVNYLPKFKYFLIKKLKRGLILKINI